MLPAHLWQIRGSDQGPCTVILGGTHGDERTGIELVRRWLGSINPSCNLLLEQPGVYDLEGVNGSLILGFGNPEAILRDSRSASSQRDLNRCFESSLLNDLSQSWTDLNRARDLFALLKRTDLLIDVHATSTPNSEPFLCFGKMTPEHERLCPLFPVEHILNDPDGVLGGPEGALELPTTDQAVNRSGGTAICYETGFLADMSKVPLAQLAIARVLLLNGIITDEIFQRLLAKDDNERSDAQQRLDSFTGDQKRIKLVSFQTPLQPTGKGFVFAEGMGRPWQPVQKEQLYGRYADGQEIRFVENGYLIFPIPSERMNDKNTLFYLGQTF